MMRWKRLGRIFEPRGVHEKLATHAANPIALQISDDTYRIFYNGRDRNMKSSVGCFDYNMDRRTIVDIIKWPTFSYGFPGSFLSDGVSIGSIYEAAGQQYLLFMGWHVPQHGHWRGEIGRLRIINRERLELDSLEPLLGLSVEDPVSLSYPFVAQSAEGQFEMWYGSTLTWDAGNGEMLHVIKHATSNDGDAWTHHGVALPYQLGEAQAFSRPMVLRDHGGSDHMWFSYRPGSGRSYRIGYARRDQGSDWALRLDEIGLDVADTGWDCEMVAYPFVFAHRGRTYMLYNGNNYGLTGIGLAVLED